MKIVNAKCKNCGAELNIDPDKTMLFCPYCGTKLLIIDGDEVKTERARADAYRDVELAREETKREKNRQEHEREKEMIEKGDIVKIELERIKSERKAEREKHRLERKAQRIKYRQEKRRLFQKSEDITEVMILVFFIILLVVGRTIGGISEYVKVYTPESSKYFPGKQFAIVQQQFKDAGFITVRSEAVEDLYNGFLRDDTKRVGTVKQVSIGGKFDYKKNAEFSRFSPVVVYYHDYPKPKDGSANNNVLDK